MDALEQLNKYFNEEITKLYDEVRKNILHRLYALGKEAIEREIERENDMLF